MFSCYLLKKTYSIIKKTGTVKVARIKNIIANSIIFFFLAYSKIPKNIINGIAAKNVGERNDDINRIIAAHIIIANAFILIQSLDKYSPIIVATIGVATAKIKNIVAQTYIFLFFVTSNNK